MSLVLGMSWSDPFATTRANAAKCGTRSGYRSHRRRGEKACAACLAANRDYIRNRATGSRAPFPPPNSFARCIRQCGRLVWHFDLGLCGRCATWTETAAECAAERITERLRRQGAVLELRALAGFSEQEIAILFEREETAS